MWQLCCDWQLSNEAHLRDLCCRAWIQFDHLGKLGWCCRRTPPQGITSCRTPASPLSAPNGATDTPLWARHKRKQAIRWCTSVSPLSQSSQTIQSFCKSFLHPSICQRFSLGGGGHTSCDPIKSFQLQYGFFKVCSFTWSLQIKTPTFIAAITAMTARSKAFD